MTSETSTRGAKAQAKILAGLKKLRNLGIMAHIDAGKTTVTERILHLTGVVHRMGEVHEGTATMDFLEDERNRGITIASAAITCEWNGHRLNLIDTPGHVDFTVEVERSLRVLDGAVAVFDAVNGVEAQSETVWRQAQRYKVPRICFINKIDRVGADYHKAVQSIRGRLGAHAVEVQLPIGQQNEFSGIIDLIERKAYYFGDNPDMQAAEEGPLPETMADDIEHYRAQLVEAVAECDEALLERFVEGEEISVDEIKAGLRKGTIEGVIFPVLCGSALKKKGMRLLLDSIVEFLPCPLDIPAAKGTNPDTEEEVERPCDPDAPFASLAFKTVVDEGGDLTFVRVYSGTVEAGDQVWNPRTGRKERFGRILRVHAAKKEPLQSASAGDIIAVVGIKQSVTGDTLCAENQPVALESIVFPEPVIAVALAPKSSKDRDKLSEALARISREDPTLKTWTDPQTEDLLISGMGELHLDIVTTRISRDFKVGIDIGKPQVAYKQTLRKQKEIEGKLVKQTGGSGQFAVVRMRIGPHPEKHFEFKNDVVGGSVPRQYVPAVQKGIEKAMEDGGELRYPIVNVHASIYDGQSHDVDSSEMAFQTAARIAFREACAGNMTLMEPVMKLEVQVPEQYVGDVVGDLGSRRTEIAEIEIAGDLRIIRGRIPVAETFQYVSDLRGMTQGRGTYSMEPDGYAIVPEGIAETVRKDRLALLESKRK
ncbi:MAG: elongation factor G [Planctomycetes bacterium]|nr:elongation factor G [Planctomycetota bacterium]MCB9891557.1 elongation factor G [Planctomycetota bacterium]